MMLEGSGKPKKTKQKTRRNEKLFTRNIHSPGSLGLNLFLGRGTHNAKGIRICGGGATNKNNNQKENMNEGGSIFINSWLPQCSAAIVALFDFYK